MRLALFLAIAIFPVSAGAFSFATGGCATNGCETGDQLLASNLTEIDTALDSIESTNTTQTSDISALTSTFASYLPLAGGTITGNVSISSPAIVAVQSGAGIVPQGTGVIQATAMSSSSQIDDNDLASSSVDGGTGGEIQDETVTGADILNDTIQLITDTAGNFVATITGDTEITVSGSGTEGRAVTLAIASTIARDSEITTAVAAVSAASSTNTAVPRFSGVSGDLQDSGVLIDSSNNVTGVNSITVGSSGYGCAVYRDTDDAGWTECCFLNGTQTCGIDADGALDGTP